MAAKAEAASEDLCDFLTTALRDRLAMETGYSSDALTQARKLSKVLRLHISEDPSGAFITFEEFHKTMLRLNFVGQQRGLEALFRRYDIEGTGHMGVETFVNLACRFVPDPTCTPPVRVAFSNMRAALRTAAGPFGVQVVINRMETSAGGAPDISSSDFKALLRETGARTREQDVVTAVKELDIQKRETLDIAEVAFALRGRLSRFRRELVNRVWGEKIAGAEGSASFEAVVGACSGSGSLAGELAHVLTGAKLQSVGELAYGEWVAICKSLSAVVPADAEFASILSEGFGVDPTVDKSTVILSGSLYDGLHQTLKGTL